MRPFVKFTLKEILNSNRRGKTEWGFIFEQKDDLRQSIDFADFVVVVEKYLNNEWRVMSTYQVQKGERSRDESESEIQFGN